MAHKFQTNLKTHLKQVHLTAYNEMMKKEEAKQRNKERMKAKKKMLASPTQITLQGSMVKAQQYDKNSPQYRDITQKLASVGNVANSIVECEELILQLVHCYPIPTWAALDREMDVLLVKVKDGVSTNYAMQEK